MFSFVTEKRSLKIIIHYSPHLQLFDLNVTWPKDMQLLKYVGTSKKFLRTSGFLLATCPGQVAEKKIWSPLSKGFIFYESDYI